MFLILFELHLSPLVQTWALADLGPTTVCESSHLQGPEPPGLGNDGGEAPPPHGGFHGAALRVGKHGQAQDSQHVGVCDGFCHVDLDGTSSVPRAQGFMVRAAARKWQASSQHHGQHQRCSEAPKACLPAAS